MPRRRSTLSVVCALGLSVTHASAQRPTADSAASRRDWLFGVSAGVPGYEREPIPELFTIGLNVSQITPGRLGADFSLGTMPRALVARAAVLADSPNARRSTPSVRWSQTAGRCS